MKSRWTDDKPWIYGTVGPGQHKGGYWNDGIDWDQYGIPYRCTVRLNISGIPVVQSNTTVNGNKYFAFSSNETVYLESYSCSGA
ncbi:hypothetical protein [Streptosporangium canum]|uniref:hypothetical protein n=1 Tax=Streptosporangium canum TaxID=324952 RepID=UPI0037972E6C